VTKEVTTCSELERFGYCPLSWWRSRKGVQGKGQELREGIKKHKSLEKGLTTITQEDVVSDDAKKGIFSFTSVTIILALSGIFFLLFGVLGEQSAAIFIILALLWLLEASYLFYRMLKSQETSEELRKEHGVPRGRIDYSDSREAESLFSKRYMLSGKPDYIIEKNDVKIPVEVKTGRIPKGPHFSHILQLGGYCLLMEDVFGPAPPYGIIEYANKQQHRIDYTGELRGTVKEKLEFIKAVERGEKDAHRNHNRLGKCRYCSRRVGCPESLLKDEEKHSSGGNGNSGKASKKSGKSREEKNREKRSEERKTEEEGVGEKKEERREK